MVKAVRKLLDRYRIESGETFHLADVDPGDTGGLSLKKEAKELLATATERMAELQSMLYAQDRWSVLLVFQALDAAGKDSTIKHVMSGINPQGCQVFSFKAPSQEELDHDWMWRTYLRLPERGRIGIFNRSYYEEVLVVRVHPSILGGQKLPPELVTEEIWEQRFADIRHFEDYLARNGTLIRKFFLHVSNKEQKKRFIARLEEPEKHWKFNIRDVQEREHWNDYAQAYEEAIRATATPTAPWFVVPADKKWFMRLVVASAIIDALETLDLHYPETDPTRKEELTRARKLLDDD